jgi:putative DNA primase/helicase
MVSAARRESAAATSQVCRASFIVGLDPDDSTGANGSARCIAHDKHNLGPWTPTKRFTLDTVDVSIAGATQPIVRAVLGEECDVTAGQMLAAEQGFENLADRKADHALIRLRGQLENGRRAVNALQEDAEAAGHAWRTVERAKKGIDAKAVQNSHGWAWELVEGLRI